MSDPLAILEPAHHPYGASGAYRWLQCTASVFRSRGTTSDDSIWALEGTLAHKYVEQTVQTGELPLIDMNEILALEICEDVQHAHVIRREIEAGCAQFLSALLFVRGVFTTVEAVHAEIKLKSSRIPEYGGTVDGLIVGTLNGARAIAVADYKHGEGVIVPLEHRIKKALFAPATVLPNTQVLEYLSLAREHYGNAGLYLGSIVQPRVGDGATQWVTVTNDQLDEFEQMVLDAQHDHTYYAGDHCRWCPALMNFCPHVLETVRKLIEMEETYTVLTLEEKAAYLEEVRSLQTALNALLKETPGRMMGLAKQGHSFVNFKVIAQDGDRAWKDVEEVTRVLADAGVSSETLFNRELRSPPQLEKLLPAQIWEAVQPLVVRPPGKRIVSRTDKRPEVILGVGHRFKDYTQGEN